MDEVAIAKSLVDELEAKLSSLEALGALVAAAHLDAAIDAFCRDLDVTREPSDPD